MASEKRVHKSVLIVEPSKAHFNWMEATLHSAGISDHKFESDPDLALDACMFRKFDLILAAYPFSIDGFEWISAAKFMLRDLDSAVVAMLTSQDQHRRRKATEKYDADDTILKPFTSGRLLALSRKLLRATGECSKIANLDLYRLRAAHRRTRLPGIRC